MLSVNDKSPAKIWVNLGLVLILLLSLWLRLTGIDWDGYYHLHPDERYIVWVGTTIEFRADWETAFDPELSTFNPFYWPPMASSSGIKVMAGEPRDFAYGHWPLYLGVAAGHLLDTFDDETESSWAAGLPESWTLLRDLLNVPGRIEYNHLLVAGRALAALFDTLTVWLVFLLGRKLYGPWVGLLAAALMATAVIHIQSAHFFITDPFLTTAVAATCYAMVCRAESKRWKHSLAAGALLGLAVGAKFTAVMLALPLLVAVMWGLEWPVVTKGTVWRQRLSVWWRWGRRPLLEMAAALLVALLVFAVTNPFALLDTSCEEKIGGFTLPVINFQVGSITLHSCYAENIGTQGAMVRGGTRIPFTYQYLGTQPYTYYLFQMFRWGLGGPLTLVCFIGLLWGLWRVTQPGRRPGEAVLLTWALPFFIVTGSFQVKFLRYLLPLIPLMVVYGAAMLCALARGRWRPLAWGLIAVTVLGTFLWAAAFVGLYRVAEHPWISASKWIYDHIPADKQLLTEHWDHALPIALRQQDYNNRPVYKDKEVEWFYVEDPLLSEERRIPLDIALGQVASSDYLVFSSNRLYGVIPRLVGRFPEGTAYYRLLFSGRLGFELVYWKNRYPTLGSVTIMDDTFAWPRLSRPEPMQAWQPGEITWSFGPADESFTVYDHPLVLIFENRDRLSAAELEKLIRQEMGK